MKQIETEEGNRLIYAYQKAHWSKPVDEDIVTNHLGYDEDDTIFCGVDKRYPGIYNMGFNPIEHLEKSEVDICKTCFNVWKSRHTTKTNK